MDDGSGEGKKKDREEGNDDDEVEIHGVAGRQGGRDPFSPAYCMPYAASLPC